MHSEETVLEKQDQRREEGGYPDWAKDESHSKLRDACLF